MVRALIIIDVQHGMFFGDWALPDAGELLNRIGNRLLLARQQGTTIFHVQNDGPAGEADSPGEPSWQLVFAAAKGERVIRKVAQNVFEDNPYLDAELRHAGITSLEFAGVQSELCLKASALGARRLGYEILLQRQLHGSYDSESLGHVELSDAVQLELMPNG